MQEVKEEKTIYDIKKEFHSIYHLKIKPMMEEFEKTRRIELVKFFSIIIAEAFIIYFCINFCSKYCTGDGAEGFLIIAMLSAFLAAWGLYAIQKSFSQNLKKKCLPKVVKVFGDMKWATEKQNLSSTEIRMSDLFSEFNRRADDDSFVGEYRGVDFTVSETSLWFVSGSSRNKIVYQVFKGVIIQFASNKNIKNKTIIATKNDIHIKGRNLAIWIAILSMLPSFSLIFFGNMSVEELWYIGLMGLIVVVCVVIVLMSNRGKEKLEEIKLEDVEFNKHYRAYSSDEVEGRYLITTSFMERFKNLHTSFGAKKAKCSFYGNDIMFAISTRKNLFEIGGLFTSLTNPKHLETFFNELSSVLNLIEYFKLDEKTGL